MTITNSLDLPQALVNAVSTKKHNKKGCLSATTLLHGAKEIVLTDRHWDAIEDDASNRVWAVFGTAVHALLEKEGAATESFTEETVSLYFPVHGKEVTGEIDCYDMQNATVYDYKTASVFKVMKGDYEDWRKQGLIYAYLLRQNGLPADKAVFIALLKDHSKAKAKIDRSYPQSPVVVKQWIFTDEDFEEIENFIKNKLHEVVEAEKMKDDEIPPCTPSERWQTESKFAVMKNGRKSALKLCDTREQAELYIKSIENNSALQLKSARQNRGSAQTTASQEIFVHFSKIHKKSKKTIDKKKKEIYYKTMSRTVSPAQITQALRGWRLQNDINRSKKKI